MRIAGTGLSGLIGSALAARLAREGHEILRLVRPGTAGGASTARWDAEAGTIDAARLEDCDAVVHLAGENIAAGRWTRRQKARIRDSRVGGTKLIAAALAGLQRRPSVLVCASAIGFYGDRADNVVDEQSSRGTGFLAEVCQEWEAAAAPAAAAGIRVVHLRFGVVLSAGGGALQRMLTPFKLCVGGRVGNGRQYMSWVSLDDAVGGACHALTTTQLVGPVNVVSPHPATNLEFTKTLGRVLGRPTILPMPALAARLAFGEMANELLLSSARVHPSKLLESGYQFVHPELEAALRSTLQRAA